MKLSQFGQKFAGESSIATLMDDLGVALNENPDMIFMGGGNPARIPAMEALFSKRLAALAQDPEAQHSLLGVYQSPQGPLEFRIELAAMLRSAYGWDISEANIAISNGSQTAFFVLFNLLAGSMSDGTEATIHLPLVPEYLGYGDAGLGAELFTATKPKIEFVGEHEFKYRADITNQSISEHTAAVCVSRPTNPTGNVLTDDEMAELAQLTRRAGIPLIVDGAYGLPFPNILFTQAQPFWDDQHILVLSLSKLGLPGVRTGIVIANEELIGNFTNANTIISLANGNLGPSLVSDWLPDGRLMQLAAEHITPFYKTGSIQTANWLHEALAGLPYYIHKAEGAFFLWLWLQDLPITSQHLYERLKSRGVLVIPGESFFIGLDEDWPHSRECLRISYAQDPSVIQRGVKIIAEEVRAAYAR